MTGRLRVFLVDDHPGVLSALAAALAALPGIDVVGTADRAESAYAALADGGVAADVAIVDVSLPGESGIDLCRRLAECRPALRCVVLSASDDVENARRALAAGAAGYLVKDISTDSLVAAVRAAAQGRFFVDPRVGRHLAHRPRVTGLGARTRVDAVAIAVRDGAL